MRRFGFALGLVGLFFATGCTDTVARLAIASTKTTDFSQNHYRAATQASADDGRLWLLVLPLGGAPSIEDAINHLLQKYNGDYLTDTKVDETWWSLLLVSWGSVSVTGDVWTAGSAPAVAPAPATAPATPAK
jgi:hypothetical protein